MGFIHGLALALIIFEGIIIQCNGAGNTTSVDWIRDPPVIDISGDQPFLPSDLIEAIISKTDFATAEKTVQSRIINGTNIVMKEILQHRIVLITPDHFQGGTNEYNGYGDFYLKFGSYRKFMSFFDKFGDQVKKIKIFYDKSKSVQSSEINQNIIKKYAKTFEELRIVACSNDGRIWRELLNGEIGTIFPEVKKFHYSGGISRNEFKLNLMFPKLESFKLYRPINDINCLANVTTLKELQLSNLTEENQLGQIFANNKNMIKITLTTPIMAETMESIAKYLTKLETLEVERPGSSFLFRTYNARLHRLSSVKHFKMNFFNITELIGDLSFDMPHLKKLTLNGAVIDNQAIGFIKHFNELETVELRGNGYNAIEFFEKLKHIKEFMVNNFENSQLNFLRKVFEHFDEKSKLQTIKLMLNFFEYHKYEDTMKKINIHLVNSRKPTWKLSHGKQTGTGQNYLMFKREKC